MLRFTECTDMVSYQGDASCIKPGTKITVFQLHLSFYQVLRRLG